MISENRRRMYTTDIPVHDLKKYDDFEYLNGLGPSYSEVKEFYMDIIYDYDGVDIREWKGNLLFKLDKYSHPEFHTVTFETNREEK